MLIVPNPPWCCINLFLSWSVCKKVEKRWPKCVFLPHEPTDPHDRKGKQFHEKEEVFDAVKRANKERVRNERQGQIGGERVSEWGRWNALLWTAEATRGGAHIFKGREGDTCST